MSLALITAPIVGILGLLFALYKAKGIEKVEPGNERMREISQYIADGAMAFLKRQYKSLAIFVILLFIILIFAPGQGFKTAISFLVGAAFSVAAGYVGMKVATKANVRTANAAMESGMTKALNIAFSGGAVMGITVVGLGILGVSALYIIFKDVNIVTGFSLGASSIALFARVGGGIYTKAADVGADLVGKVEAGIPEDDPRNPAVIADNVGDNVGDVAGMGADLFESYVGAIISALTLGTIAHGKAGVQYAIALSSVGVVASILGVYFVRGDKDPQKSLNNGTLASSVITVIAGFFLSNIIIGSYKAFIAMLSGLVVGLIISRMTEYYTSGDYSRLKRLLKN